MQVVRGNTFQRKGTTRKVDFEERSQISNQRFRQMRRAEQRKLKGKMAPSKLRYKFEI